MKMRKSTFLLVAAGGVIGWCLGYLKIPFLDERYSFLFGAIFGMTLTFLLSSFKSRGSTQQDGQKSNKFHYSTILLLILTMASLAVAWSMFEKQKALAKNIETVRKHSTLTTEAVDAMEKNYQLLLSSNIIDQVRHDLLLDTSGKLSNSTIDQVAGFSKMLKPVMHLAADSSQTLVSETRGKLLKVLLSLQIDSTSFSSLLSKATFAYADLTSADLQHKNLSGIDLRGAILRDAKLNGVVMMNANLRECIAEGVSFSKALLQGTNFESSLLDWTNFKDADLSSCTFNGSEMNHSTLYGANLSETTLQFASLNNAIFSNATMRGTDMISAKLHDAVLEGVTINSGRLKNAELIRTNLNEVTLIKVCVTDKWIDQIKEWKPLGSEQLVKKYEVGKDTSARFPRNTYYTKEIK